MKAHIGVDAVTGLTHSVVATSANVAEVTMAAHLIRDDDQLVYGDVGYTGMWKYMNEKKDTPGSRCCVAAKRGPIKKMDDSPMKCMVRSWVIKGRLFCARSACRAFGSRALACFSTV